MSEGEIVEAITAYYDLAISLVALYVTVISAYLIVAYLAGSRITSSQMMIISVLFIVMAGVVTYGAYGFLRRAFEYIAMQAELSPELTNYANPMLAYLLPALMLGGIFAALKFMWDVRHPKTE
jgi:hypothetical protein